MSYKISICHPDKPEIEERDIILDKQQVFDFFSKYPWREKMDIVEKMRYDDVQYHPSLRFTHTTNKRWLELTAGIEDDKLVFGIYYQRPTKVKILFGLFGTTNVIRTVDKFPFTKENTKQHLNTFLEEEFDELEKVMIK